MDFYDEIYYSLMGNMVPEAALPWVPNVFVEGSECHNAYVRLLQARNRLLEKLGVDEDPDLEAMQVEMDTIQYEICRQLMLLRRM